MGKAKSFADKMNKATADNTTHCQECGESFTMAKVVRTEKSDKTGAWKFREQFVGLCKCNAESVTQ